MVSIKTNGFSDFISTDITLTRGDDVTLALGIYTVDQNGVKTPYVPDVSDVIKVEVRKSPITSSAITPIVVFAGSVTIDDDVPYWHISHTDSTIDCGEYYWDAQITISGEVYTFYQGLLNIVPEVTL